MKRITNPGKDKWPALCERPVLDLSELDVSVRAILNDVKERGDRALFYLTEKYDGAALRRLAVSPEEMAKAAEEVPDSLKDAIRLAGRNIEKFHRTQLTIEPKVETVPGVTCWRKNVAIEKVGLYIPGGTAPLFSTVLMLGIPAVLAGCEEIVLCTPPDRSGRIQPAVLFTAGLLGITRIFKVGGAQAIAAMACGTESIPAVYKIFGPGNQYVTKAKEIIQADGVAIDIPAGPSELLVIADISAEPEFVAADLLSQAEHGIDSQVVLLSDDAEVIQKTEVALKEQLAVLPRKEIAAKALKNSLAIVFPDIRTCMEFSNRYAPEHLIIATEDTAQLAGKVVNAGSVFIGNYSCESAGDYASGTNHSLPTNAYARSYSGVSADSFVRKITFQEVNETGIRTIGPAIETLAEAEGLDAHRNAVSLRLKKLKMRKNGSE